MREAVVVASSRTPLAKSQRGSFNITRPDDLAGHAIRDVLGKAPQLDPKEVEDVILGCGQPHGSQGHNIARVAAIRGGLPVTVAGTTVNRFCSSGLQAIAMASHLIINEGLEAAIGGGVESITMMQRDSSPNPWVKEHFPGVYMVMGDTAEVVAKRYNVSRQTQDEYALLSQQRTARAQQEGFFKEELAPMQVKRAVLDRKTGEKIGEEDYYVDKDECNRADTTLEGLMSLAQASRPQGRGHRRVGAERGLRLPGRLLPRSPGAGSGQAEQERRVDLDRASVRHDRFAHGRHAGQRDAAQQGALRRRHDVHRRRPGRSGPVRGLPVAARIVQWP